jgi:heme-degrading monooxygenase HmoA
VVQIDLTNRIGIGLDLYTVAPRHQEALIQALLTAQIPEWKTHHAAFLSATIHRSLDGVRVFVYSQWDPKFDYRSLVIPVAMTEFFPPDAHLLEVFASHSQTDAVPLEAGETVTHLAEFRMIPRNQPEMVDRATQELTRAASTPGLRSATFHRSLDGTRVFNYGQWDSFEAFEAILKQPGFNPDQPYWEGIARNEFHLYHVAHVMTR